MADVEQQLVRAVRVRAEVIHVMERKRQFDHAQIAGQVPAVRADGIEDGLTDLTRQLLQLIDGQWPEVSG